MFARRTESLDATEIEKLVTADIVRIFGRANIVHVIEKCLLSVTLTSEEDEIIGFAAFYDYPATRPPSTDGSSGAVPEADWAKSCDLEQFQVAGPLNSLFMHYFVSVREREVTVLTEIVNTVFTTAAEIHFIFTNTEKGILFDIFGSAFQRISGASQLDNWFVLCRDSYMPRLFIRPARQEDNDDLTPIFNAQSKVLEKIYGEFYIAEMVAAQSDSMKCLVAEVDSKAIGFICVSKDGDIDTLNLGFFLEPFNGFRKENESDAKADSNSRDDLVAADVIPGFEKKLHPKDVNESSLPLDQGEQHNLSRSISEASVSSGLEPAIAGGIIMSGATPDLVHGRSTGSHISGHYWYQKSQIDTMDVPYYSGSSNALVIQLFAIQDQYEMRSIDFLLHIFSIFPSRDFLLITIPHMVPEFALLENFVRVTPRPGVILPHELYCFHKASLFQNFVVRRLCTSDQDAVESLVDNLTLSPNILEDVAEFNSARRFKSGHGLEVYVAECLESIVGVAVMENEREIEYIRSHYNIEDFIYFTHHRRQEHGHLRHFALNPIFKRLTKVFLKEMMRKAAKSSIYYPLYKSWADKKLVAAHSLVTCLQEMVPVRPRRQIVYDLEKLDGGANAPMNAVLAPQPGFCLAHINTKLLMEPKITVNARIVVVGASTTGLSFLDFLCFCPHLKFNNIFLVSPHGLPDDHVDDEFLEQLTGTDFNFSKKKLEYSAMRIQVTVIKGFMTAIDRKKKRITVSRRHLLPYDHLIVTNGLQFSIPFPTDAQSRPDGQAAATRRYSEQVFKKKEEKVRPRNLFTVNDMTEGVALLEAVRNTLLTDPDSQVVLYGHSFETYCCLHTLLAMGVYGHRLHFVKPPSEEENLPLNNPEVEASVYGTLKDAGVSIYNNFSLSRFNENDSEMPIWISSATFSSCQCAPVRIECKVFISYYRQCVNYDAFRALNDACLVFDSRLVIDTGFHTNDPSIRAAGPMTKFQRRFYSDQWHHGRFNSKVVGEELARAFLRLFDPTLEPLEGPPNELQNQVFLVPSYPDALVRSALLPGGCRYLHVMKPMLPVPLANQMSFSNYGQVLTTGDPNTETGYFRLHLNTYNKVETITCLRKKDYPVENLIQLFGIHERALNNLHSRFKEGLITDLFDFFSDTWSVAFYHDRFTDLRSEIKDLMLTRSSPCNVSFEEMVREAMTEGNQLTSDEREQLMRQYQETGAKKTVDQRLIGFLAYNQYHLPMYARPDLV